jgi:hypothetical protein
MRCQYLPLIKVYLTQQVGPVDCVALGNSYQAMLNSDVQKLIEIDYNICLENNPSIS